MTLFPSAVTWFTALFSVIVRWALPAPPEWKTLRQLAATDILKSAKIFLVQGYMLAPPENELRQESLLPYRVCGKCSRIGYPTAAGSAARTTSAGMLFSFRPDQSGIGEVAAGEAAFYIAGR